MRYKVIDNKRLNVYLTKNDLQKENVTIEDIVVGNEKSVIKIKKIFKVVSKLAHFNTNNKLLNIVLMPVIDGDLIISAGISECEGCSDTKTVFVFENFEDLLDACFAVGGGIILSTLFLLDDKYYLTIETYNLTDGQNMRLNSKISEYGEKSEYSFLFIFEHGKVLIKERAVEKMLQKFC